MNSLMIISTGADVSIITGYLMIAKQFVWTMHKFGGFRALKWGSAAMAAALQVCIFVGCAVCGYFTHMIATMQSGHVVNPMHVYFSIPLAIITWIFVLMKQTVILASSVGSENDPLYLMRLHEEKD